VTETIVISVRNEERPFRFSFVPLHDGDKVASVFVLAAEHTTESPLERVRAEFAEEREQTLAVIAHDLKNPLNVMSLSTYQLATLQLPPDQKEKVKKQVDAIKRSAKRINDLLGDVLDLARLQMGSLNFETEPCTADRLVAEAMEQVPPIAQQKQITIERMLEPGLRVSCDRERTARVLTSLITNAVNASPEQGLVMVRVTSEGDRVVFEVRDTGPGVREDERDILFHSDLHKKRGEKRKLGRGLPLARGVVEAQRGKIWVESQPGRGAAFYFTLPVAGEA
jgi:signal transduction histidine kinase